jgi:nucleotide-binding universal stress UspA family protein
MTWTRVVVGIDGSPASARALRWGAEEASEHEAEIYVVMAYAVPAPPVAVGLAQPPWRDQDAWRADAERLLQETLLETLGDAPGIEVRTEVVEGSPAKALIDASQRADLVVVGTRGHGGFAGMLLGSVSQHVTAHAACAVTVVR